jgi:hypothetical protein
MDFNIPAERAFSSLEALLTDEDPNVREVAGRTIAIGGRLSVEQWHLLIESYVIQRDGHARAQLANAVMLTRPEDPQTLAEMQQIVRIVFVTTPWKLLNEVRPAIAKLPDAVLHPIAIELATAIEHLESGGTPDDWASEYGHQFWIGFLYLFLGDCGASARDAIPMLSLRAQSVGDGCQWPELPVTEVLKQIVSALSHEQCIDISREFLGSPEPQVVQQAIAIAGRIESPSDNLIDTIEILANHTDIHVSEQAREFLMIHRPWASD